MRVIKFKKELNFDIKEYNHILDLSELLINGKKIPVTMNYSDNNETKLHGFVKYRFREVDENVSLTIIFNKEKFLSVELELNDEGDIYTEYDLKYFYYEEIQDNLYKYRNVSKKKYAIRNYRAIYNSYAIKGGYTINCKNKFQFFSLRVCDRSEPMTEHIIAFDVEVEETSLDRARSKVHNLVSDYCAFLSVLLDIGFEEVNSKYVNYVILDKITGMLAEKRHRTSFIDGELNLIVKDNLNGLMHKKDMNKGPLLGYISYGNIGEGDVVTTEKIGSTPYLEETFSKHRIYKTKINTPSDYIDEIDESVHFPNNMIPIPRQIRNYFKGIFELEEFDYEKYKMFRNACRLYNLSHIFGNISPTAQISYLISTIDALSKSEKLTFGQFVRKYSNESELDLLNYMYGKVRSGHFHSGEFCFREYNVELNVSADPTFFLDQSDYYKTKLQLRKILIEWIKIEIIKEKKKEETEENPISV
ncbi:hypothetical protein [Clostridium saccharoperbutylacetonicum]|uniref:hypothetical protein n=1 Tax=Clostridium saccharoperbutylacetonicum TaxID=36745 RepID=UPI000983B600|nr:hypothetical protein [Clostridium saccharoperbutylacetonicum]AQR96119.1 hypothetical protein CLSAP_34380 [Clostridium saccharoperbutylacetonicum]NSB31988.1 hypothetical protein [Clostridium saccharoperbutylacetonicum]